MNAITDPKAYKQPNLFDEPFKIKTGVRKVAYTLQTVTVGSSEFSLHDLCETLDNVLEGDAIVTNPAMCKVLKRLNVLKWCGKSRAGMSATPDRRFMEFFDLIKNLAEND
jgi:hypothetical protein